MFESIRKHSKTIMFLLFLLIIPSFIFVGIDQSYFSGSSPTVAKVDGQDITQADWDNMHRLESDRIRAQTPQMDAKLLDTPQARYATLERMVRDRVFQVAVQKQHLVTSDATLARTLHDIPAIAGLKRADGSLDTEGYRALLAAQGLTPEGFEAALRRDLSSAQVVGGIMDTPLATRAVANVAIQAFLQRREVRVAMLDARTYADKVPVADADLQAFYQTHSAQFQQPERASVEYVVLSMDTVREQIQLNEEDVKTYYRENAARLAGVQAQVQARHILVNAPKSMSNTEREAARQKAQALLEQVKASPERFAETARAQSQDPGSAPSGGALGYFSKGAMVPEFEQAAFALKKGEISDLVESEFGYHIIQVTDVKEPVVPAFEAMRSKVEQALKDQQAQRTYAEVAETFANTVYEEADSLEPVARKLGLQVQKADDVTRTPAVGASGPLANAHFLEALFSSDALESKRNTDAIELGTHQMVAGRVTAYSPAKQLPFDEAKARIQSMYVAQQAAKLAHEDGQTKLKAWREDGGAQAQGLQAAVTVSRDDLQGLPQQIVDAVLQTKTETLPAWDGIDMGEQGYAIVKVQKIISPDQQNDELWEQTLNQYVQLWASAEGSAYYEILKKRFDVQFKVIKP